MSQEPEPQGLRAADIPIASLRQCLIWPLALAEPDRAAAWFHAACAALPASGWEPVADPLDLAAADNHAGAYEEAVYFHHFVRDLLYRGADSALFTRPLRRLTAVVDDARRDFAVDLCALRLFRSGVAVLTLDLAHDGPPLSLAQAQTVIDHLRRAYPAFWFAPDAPGFCPSAVEIDGAAFDLGALRDRKAAEAALRANGLREPLFPWWTWLVAPLTVEGAAPPGALPPLRQVLDERIPLLTTLSLSRGAGSAADLTQVGEGDWWRLALADAAGEAPWAYNPAFLRAEGGAPFYDRFRPDPQTDPSGATRYLIAGCHLAAVGAGRFFDTHVARHMRSHYRQMATLCVLEFATLLMLSSRLSRAAADRAAAPDRAAADRAFRKAAVDIEAAFLDFTHAVRFTGVSSQLQAREMFDRLRAAMGLDRLYDDVRREIDDAARLAIALDQRDAAQAADRAADAARRLTELATLAAAIGLVTGVAGMNILIGEPLETWLRARFGWRTDTLGWDAAQLGAVLTLVSGGLLTLAGRGASATLKWTLGGLAAAGLATVLLGLGPPIGLR
jgi:hypothetical protein